MIGRVLLTIDAAALMFGAIIADMNHTHQYNPNWPPHAKFHNAQTINLSVFLGLATLYYTWKLPTSDKETTTSNDDDEKRGGKSSRRELYRRDYAGSAAFTGSIYWIAGMLAIFYPETMGLDPEFGGPGFPQLPIFAGFMSCGLLGGWLEWVRR